MLMDTIQRLGGADFDYDISFSTLSTPTDGAVLGRFSVTRNFTIPAGLTNSIAESETATTGAASYLLKKNGTQFGSFDFGAASNASTGVAATATTFVSGDIITLEAPATADATHDLISFTVRTTAT